MISDGLSEERGSGYAYIRCKNENGWRRKERAEYRRRKEIQRDGGNEWKKEVERAKTNLCVACARGTRGERF